MRTREKTVFLNDLVSFKMLWFATEQLVKLLKRDKDEDLIHFH